jgi:hypothetical protein
LGVRVLFIEAPQAMLDERRRLGLDRRDEMWDGVLHVVPLPSVLRALGGRLVPVQPGPDGECVSEVLGIALRTIDGKLEITWDGGSAVV